MAARLFVYGSLKRGERHHDELAGGRFLREATTAPRYGLVDLGAYPGLVEGGTDAVAGELWEVEAEHLARLDAFEEHPDVYERRGVALADGTTAESYFHRPRSGDRVRWIASGRWP